MPPAPTSFVRDYLTFPDNVWDVVLAGAAVEVTKPTGMVWALILPSAVIYARKKSPGGGDAAVPAADIVDGTGSFSIGPNSDFREKFWNVSSLTSFSLIGTAVVAICWYGEHRFPST